MQPLQQYVLEPVKTGDLDDKTIAKVFEVLETILGSVYDLERFKVVVERKLMGPSVVFWVAEMGKNFFIKISGVRRGGQTWHCLGSIARSMRVRLWKSVKSGHSRNTQYNDDLLIKAKFRGTRSLQDLAAHQVACSIRNNLVSLERLPIPKLTKKVVAKFVKTANI
eukprot:GFUD01044136.1.p1 GENE.GFUD01044136.1~~GFUD01044136.1.p1  ORF type:complete len:166 (-),score=33.36 GFUD01044136.1:133-630(-)